MSQQLALSSLFSVLALASLCLVATADMIGSGDAAGTAATYSVQAESVPGLDG